MAEAVSPFALTTLARFKTFAGLSTTTDDDKNTLLVNAVSRAIERYCGRPLVARNFTEYHSGNGSGNKVYTRAFPIIAVSTLKDDPDRSFGSSSAISASNFTIQGNENSGIIELIGGGTVSMSMVVDTTFLNGVQNIQIVYTGGQSVFVVEEGINDAIDFKEGGSEITATLLDGVYNGTTMATEIDRALELAGVGPFTVSYDYDTHKFTIVSTGSTFEMDWVAGTNTLISAKTLLGFTAADTGALTYTSDDQCGSVEPDLEMACWMWAKWQVERRTTGFATSSKSIGDGSVSFIATNVPRDVRNMLAYYHTKEVFFA